MRALLFGLLLASFSGFAQPRDTSQQLFRRPPFTLKIAALDLINPIHQTILLQTDIPLAARWGIDVGVGWVFNSTNFAQYKEETFRGLKVRPAIKYYFSRSKAGDDYISLVFKYNNLYNDRYVDVLRQGRQYSEWMLQRRHYTTLGISARIGTQLYMDKAQRWIVEPFFGLGTRQVTIKNGDLPPDAELIDNRNFFSLERVPGTYSSPDIMLGCFISWVTGRRK